MALQEVRRKGLKPFCVTIDDKAEDYLPRLFGQNGWVPDMEEIAVLKLIGTRNSTISWMILQESLGLGLVGFIIGKTVATLWTPVFPKYVLLLPLDAVLGLLVIVVVCTLASVMAIRAALKFDPAEAIGG
ncbi:FtsX-like permease family protein [Thiothrix winogradskyi]|uniref:ABC3 transporter permease C-terminal domain-containing protein n=1 Tax=Thiothrix winogradskyi TaxID=96472 RepID=A0ABY3SXE3_9GAMM|nr:ABC transporter permease [Thiothrix winogradskyi]UJS24182.1 hypothetical protein L2Y54_19970 [Thiothrix winogradskyi]